MEEVCGIEEMDLEENMEEYGGATFGITKTMEDEEKKMHEINQREVEKLRKSYEAEKHKQEMKEKHYKCLLTLLHKSEFYTKILQKRLEDSLKENEQKTKKKKKKFCNLDSEKFNNLKSEAAHIRNENQTPNVKNENKENEQVIAKNHNESETDSENKNTKVTSMGFEVPIEQPDLLEGACLRDYQLQGFNWLKLLYEGGMNGILADEMGLGKTVQCIALLCYLYEKGITGPFLIVAPLSTLPNWLMEFETFAPQIPVLMFHGNEKERLELSKKISMTWPLLGRRVYPVVLTSYEMPRYQPKVFMQPCWKVVAVDEGHKLKNYNTLFFGVMSSLKSSNRLLLTGTPLQNNLTELWSLLNFLLPEVFDKLDAFETWFQIEEMEKVNATQELIRQEKESNVLSCLHNILSPFLLRRIKTDVNLNLPPKKEVIVYCPLTPIQHELYKVIVEKSISRLLKMEEDIVDINIVGENLCKGRMTRSKYNNLKRKRHCTNYNEDRSWDKGFPVNSGNVSLDSVDSSRLTFEKTPKSLSQSDIQWGDGIIKSAFKMTNITMMLKKLVNHLYLLQRPSLNQDFDLDTRVITSSGKTLILDQLLARLKAAGHKVLIFSTMVIVMDVLEEVLDKRGYEYTRLDGRTKLDDRREAIRSFNTNPSIFAFLLSTRAGGLGINLTAADTVIIYDSDWNPQMDLQAQDRCHRIGQTQPVMVYRLVCDGTIDEKIVSRAESKRKLEKIILQKGKFNHGLSYANQKTLVCLEDLRELLESKQHNFEVHPNGSLLTDEQWSLLLDRSGMK